jgi:predicted dehydrogenase
MYNFAIIGCGQIATRHAEHIAVLGRLLAVCDTVPEKAYGLSKKFGARAYNSIDALLAAEKDVHIVAVCTPNGLHAEHSIKALQQGKHVLCEKPMCLTSVAAWQMIDTAYFFRRKLFVVKQNRFNPPVIYLKGLLDTNKLGAIYSFQVNGFWNRPQEYYSGNWRGTKTLDGGILYTQFSHFIDLMYWLLGDVKSVKAVCKDFKQRTEIEDTVVATAELQSGAVGTLHFSVNSYSKNREGSFTLLGEKGSVKIGGQYLNELEWCEVQGETPPQLSRGNPANEYGFYTGSMSNHRQVYEQLLQSLHNESGTIPEGLDAVKTVEIIERIYNAAETT